MVDVYNVCIIYQHLRERNGADFLDISPTLCYIGTKIFVQF